MQKLSLNLLYISLALGIYFYLTNLNIEGIDIAYKYAFRASNSIDSFYDFIQSQGYPSLTLWLFYLISNTLGFTYKFSHAILGIIYIYNIFDIARITDIRLKKLDKNLFKISFLLFFIFGQFGLALILSAEKMLLAMIFFTFAVKSGIKSNKNWKIIFYILSTTTHITMIISIFLIEYKNIFKTLNSFLMKLMDLKIKFSSIFFLSSVFILFSYSFNNIFNKLDRLIASRLITEVESSSTNSFLLILSSIFIMYLVLSKLNYKNFLISIFSIVPIFLKIPLGRIAWLFSFAVFFKPIVLKKEIIYPNIYISYLVMLSLYYVFKSYIIIQNGCLFSCK